MKNYKYFVSMIFVTISFAVSVAAQSTASPFSGTWKLDRTKTSVKDIPRTLKDYKMFIALSDNQIGIRNMIDGKIETYSESNTSGRSASSQEGIWGDSRQPSSPGANVFVNYNGSLALYSSFTPNEAAYKLDDKEMEVEIVNEGKVIGTAKTKAKMEKDGKSIKITTVRRMKTMRAGQTENLIYIREKLELTEEGLLKYGKTVEFPNGRESIVLYFNKVPA